MLDLLKETKLLEAKPVDTPTEQHHGVSLESGTLLQDVRSCQRLVGWLLNLNMTRPYSRYSLCDKYC